MLLKRFTIRIVLLLLINNVIFLNKAKGQKLINGEYPRVITKNDNSNVVLLYKTGALVFDEKGLQNNIITTEPDFPFTDEYSHLFRLNAKMLVLLSKSQLQITIFDEDFTDITKIDTSYINSNKDFYKSITISDSSFFVSWVDKNYLRGRIFTFNEGTKEIKEDSSKKIEINSDSSQAIACDYHPTKYKYVCIYLTNNFQYIVLDSDLRQLSISNDSGYKLIQNPLIKYFKDDVFSFCFYFPSTGFKKVFECIKLELKDDNEIKFGNKVKIGDENQYTNANVNILITQNSLFTVTSTGTQILLNRLTSNIDQIGQTINGSDNQNLNYPFIFTIRDDVAGYVHQKNNEIYMTTYIFPVCKDSEIYTQITKSVNIKFSFESNGTESNNGIIQFYQLPRNALLKYENDFVLENQMNVIGEYTLVTLLEAGIATITYSGIEYDKYGSRECTVSVIMCYFTCKTCNTNLPSIDNHQCTECINAEYHPIKGRETMCVNEQTKDENHYLNNETGKYEECSTSCSSCVTKHECIKCAKDFYPKEDTKECFEKTEIFDYFFYDSEQGKFRKCDEMCQSCSKAGTDLTNNCIDCKKTYEKINPYDDTQCGLKCEGKWIYDKTKNEVKCLGEVDCPNSHPYLIESVDAIKNQCVKSCQSYLPNSDCVICQEKRLYLYKDEMKCVESCPLPETKPNYITNECEDPSVNPDPDPNPDPNPDPEEPSTDKRIKIFQEVSRATSYINKYIFPNNHKDFKDYLKEELRLRTENQNTLIDLIQHFICADYSMTIFKLSDDDISPKVYEKYNVASIDFTSIFQILKRIIKIKTLDKLYVIQWDINRKEELTNQVEYVLYNSNGSPLDLTLILGSNISINYPILDVSNSFIQNAISMVQKNIDVYNQSSLFFNDICFKYSSDKFRDITIEDRRKDYYPPKELCQVHCKYLLFDYVNMFVKCECPYQDSFTFVNETRPNPGAISFPDKDYQTYTVVKCANSVFTTDILFNISFWVFLVFCVTIIVLAFCFICVGMSYATKYVQEVLKNSGESISTNNLLPCPPKSVDKKISPCSAEESFHTQIEEEVFDDVKINNFQKKGDIRLRQNYVNGKINKPTPGYNLTYEREEASVINKLREGLSGNNNEKNQNLNMYYFTRNSDNESNPNYTKGGSTEYNPYNTEDVRSTNFKQKMNNNMFLFDYDNELEKKGIDTKGVLMGKTNYVNQDDTNSDAQNVSAVRINTKEKNSKRRESESRKAENGEKNSQSPLKLVQAVNTKDDDNDIEVKSAYSFCRAYFNYTKKREIFFITFCSNKSYLPFFITFPIFLFCLTIIFTIHSLLFTNGFIHKRYKEDGNIDVNFWFKNEFFKCFYVALIGNVIKIIIIKILIFLVFRIEKKMLSKNNYPIILKRLRCRSTVIFAVLILVMGVLFYINTCYCGILVNTQAGIFIGYVVSIAFSFLISLFLCFIINLIRLFGICCNCA